MNGNDNKAIKVAKSGTEEVGKKYKTGVRTFIHDFLIDNADVCSNKVFCQKMATNNLSQDYIS